MPPRRKRIPDAQASLENVGTLTITREHIAYGHADRIDEGVGEILVPKSIT